jgi:uncharacterized protein (TIGR02588 family)
MADESNETRSSEPSLLEKIATAISVVLVVSLFSVLVFDAFHPNTEPSLAATVGPLRETTLAYRAQITVRNVGDDAAKSVVVHAELRTRDSTLSKTDVTVDWLPGQSSRAVVVLFARAPSLPRPTEIRAEVRGFTVP